MAVVEGPYQGHILYHVLDPEATTNVTIIEPAARDADLIRISDDWEIDEMI